MEYEHSFEQVQYLIDNGQNEEAENMLMTLQTHPDQAKWNYMMAVVSMNKGWLEYAAQYAEKAHELEPDNSMYSSYIETIRKQRSEANKNNHIKSAAGCCIDCAYCCECLSSFS